MRFIASLPAWSQTWLLNGPLAPHLDAFAAHLADGAYSAQTTRNHFLGVAHFVWWMTQCPLPVSLLDRALARMQEPDAKIRRYKAPDSLLAFLKAL